MARKLEKLESLGREGEGDSSDEDPDNDPDYPSLESERNGSGPASLAESMQLVDAVLGDGKLDRLGKIDRLESILSAAALLGSDGDRCPCRCRSDRSPPTRNSLFFNEKRIIAG